MFLSLQAAWLVGFTNLSCLEQFEQISMCESSDYLVWSASGSERFEKAICQVDPFTSVHFLEDQSGVHAFLRRLTSDGRVEIIDEVKSECSADLQNIPTSNFHFSNLVRRNFISSESFSLVASQSNCDLLKTTLQSLIYQFKSEGRSNVELICIPNKVVQTKDPSAVRKYIYSKLSAKSTGLYLVGPDLPMFEFYSEVTPGDYRYGNSDIPYGDMAESFWNSALKKSKAGIRNKIYFDKDHVYLTTSPTPFTYNLRGLSTNALYGRTQGRRLWVSRWVGSSDLLSDFNRFARRRIEYRPTISQNYLHLRGGSGLMFALPDNAIQSFAENDLRPFIANLPSSSQSVILTNAYLFGLLKRIDRNTSFLTMDDHGNSLGLGDLESYNVKELEWLPEIINADACLTGNWWDAADDNSWMTQVFHRPSPPIAVVASRGVKWLRTIGMPDAGTAEVLFNGWKKGQSLGQRQIETLRMNLQARTLADRYEFYGQVLHSLSIFGDPTVEF